MPNTPNAANTVTITLPPNMTKEQYLASHKKWEDEKILANKKMAADWRAMTAICKAHAKEYYDRRVAEYKKEGLDSSKLKMKS